MRRYLMVERRVHKFPIMEGNPRDVRMAMAVPVENAPESETYELPEEFEGETAVAASGGAVPADPFEPGSLGWMLPWAETGRAI